MLRVGSAEQRWIILAQRLVKGNPGIWRYHPRNRASERAARQKLYRDHVARHEAEGMLKFHASLRNVVNDDALISPVQVQHGR